MLTLDNINELLLLKNTSALPQYEEIKCSLNYHKDVALSDGNQALAKDIWCFEHTAEVQELYIMAHHQLRCGDYYDGWCTLEQVELASRRLFRHFELNWDKYWLRFIGSKTRAIQSLYPYRIFISPEILEIEKKCSICGHKVSIRNPCGHRVGEIYNGEYCGRIVTKSEFVSMSFVDEPVQKYSVPFSVNPETGESRDQYNYSTVEYLAKRWPSPFLDWSVEWKKALHPKDGFGRIRRNDKCPCDSGKKYKRCCMHRGGIIRPHCEFSFNYPLHPEFQTIELSY